MKDVSSNKENYVENKNNIVNLKNGPSTDDVVKALFESMTK